MKDFRGTELKVGDKVAHASRYASSLWLEEATIIEIKAREPSYSARETEYAVIEKKKGKRSTVYKESYLAKL